MGLDSLETDRFSPPDVLVTEKHRQKNRPGLKTLRMARRRVGGGPLWHKIRRAQH